MGVFACAPGTVCLMTSEMKIGVWQSRQVTWPRPGTGFARFRSKQVGHHHSNGPTTWPIAWSLPSGRLPREFATGSEEGDGINTAPQGGCWINCIPAWMPNATCRLHTRLVQRHRGLLQFTVRTRWKRKQWGQTNSTAPKALACREIGIAWAGRG